MRRSRGIALADLGPPQGSGLGLGLGLDVTVDADSSTTPTERAISGVCDQTNRWEVFDWCTGGKGTEGIGWETRLWCRESKRCILAGLGGGTHLLLAFLSHLAIDHAHPFRDGAPFLLLIETPPTFGCSVRFFHILHKKCLLILFPSCFAVCGHHVSPRIAIVFSLLPGLPNVSTSHSSNFTISSNTSRSSLHSSHSPTASALLSIAVPHGRSHTCSHVLLNPTSGRIERGGQLNNTATFTGLCVVDPTRREDGRVMVKL